MAGRPYLAVYTKNRYHGFIEGETPRLHTAKGTVIEVLNEDDGKPSTVADAPFCRVIVSDALISDLKDYVAQWEQVLDWSVSNSNLGLDSHRLTISATNPGASGEGNLLIDSVAQTVVQWGGVIDTQLSTDNSIVCNMTVFNAIKSRGFFGYEAVAAVTFTEIGYVQATGVHTVTADYSTIGAGSSAVEKALTVAGATIISNVNKVATFSVSRSTIVAAFKEAIKAKKKRIRQQRYHVPAVLVDSAIASGGDVVITMAQLQTDIIDASA